MPQLKPRLTPLQAEKLRKARERKGKGLPFIYPMQGMTKEAQLAVIQRIKQDKERSLIEKMKQRKVAKIRGKIIREIEPAFEKMTHNERTTIRPSIMHTLSSELSTIRFPETRKEAEQVERVLRMHRKGKGKTINSHDIAIIRGGSKVTGTELAVRLVSRELIQTARQIGIAHESALVVERLLHNRNQKIHGTNVTTYPPNSLLFIKLINREGEQKAVHVIDEVEKRAVEIQKDANSLGKETNYSDVFVNVSQKVQPLQMGLEMNLMNKEKFVKQAWNDLMTRTQAVASAKKTHGAALGKVLDKISSENMSFMGEIQEYMKRNNIGPHVLFSK